MVRMEKDRQNSGRTTISGCTSEDTSGRMEGGVKMKYKVMYQSMTATYGPRIIEADNEYDAKRIFAGTAFRKEEYGLIKVKKI